MRGAKSSKKGLIAAGGNEGRETVDLPIFRLGGLPAGGHEMAVASLARGKGEAGVLAEKGERSRLFRSPGRRRLRMEFFFAILFLVLYYLRPQDWVPGMAGLEIVRPLVAFWILALVAGRSRPSPLPGFARTPHDWAMFAYLGYILFFGGGSIMGLLPFLAFYALTVQSVNSWDRLSRYLVVWNGLLFGLALLGVLSTVGIDLTGAQDLRYTQMGRLSLGTWLHNNPNALAHSIVAALPASYVLFFWKGSLTGRSVVFPLFAAVVFYCAWLTQSKGGYVVGAALLVIALILGRPRWFQVIAVAATLTVGVSALSFLPRMSEMGNLRADEGVQGRLLAWEMAKTVADTKANGEGWRKFHAMIPWREGNRTLIVPKATHSSYVQVAADLGRYGLFLYFAALWCALHTVLFFKSADTGQERCRRVLLIFLFGNIVSGWMINREYHTEYFLLIAATAALHRLRKADELEALAKAESPALAAEGPPVSAAPKSADLVRRSLGTIKEAWRPRETPAFKPAPVSPLSRKPLWNRFGLFDFATSFALTWLTLVMWDYILKNL